MEMDKVTQLASNNIWFGKDQRNDHVIPKDIYIIYWIQIYKIIKLPLISH